MNTNASLTPAELAVVRDILIKQLDVSAEQLTPDARLMADLGADSLDVMEISMAAEERFGLSFADEELERLDTVEDLLEAVAHRLHP